MFESEEISNRLEWLYNRINELETAIKTHRSQKLDDRCWLDDQELYKVLNDGDLGDNSTPPMEKMLNNCRLYLEKRCNPSEKWRSYQEIEAENRELREKLENTTKTCCCH